MMGCSIRSGAISVPSTAIACEMSFSFLDDKTYAFPLCHRWSLENKEFEVTLEGRITRLDRSIARLYFVEKNQVDGEWVETIVPPGVAVRRAAGDEKAPRLQESFLIDWMSAYEVWWDTEKVLRLDEARGYSITGPSVTGPVKEAAVPST